MKKEEIAEFYRNLEDQKTDGLRLDDLKIENTPVWWFFKKRIIRNRLPPNFNNFEKIQNASHKKISFILPFLARINHNLKNFGSSKLKTSTGKQKIGVLIHTNAIHKKQDKIEIDRIQTLLTAIEESGEIEWIPLFIDPLSQQFKFTDKPENHISNFIEKKTKNSSKLNAKRIHKLWTQWTHNSNISKNKIWEGAKHNLNFHFSTDFLRIIFEIYFGFKEALKKIEPDILIVYATGGYECRALIAAAEELNKKIVFIPHGINAPAEQWDMPENVFVFAQNQRTKRKYIELGANKNNIIVTGPIGSSRKIFKPINQKAPLLLMTQCIVEESFDTEESYTSYLKTLLSELDNFDVVIKPHPLEKINRLKQLAGKNARIEKSKMDKTELDVLINSSSLVVTFFSTCILDSLKNKRPVILLDYCLDKILPKEYHNDYTHPMLIKLHDLKDISFEIKKLKQKKWEKSDDEVFFSPEEDVETKMIPELKRLIQ